MSAQDERHVCAVTQIEGAIGTKDAQHLVWLRDRSEDCFVAGAGLHPGPDAHRLDEREMALPTGALWS